MIPWKESLFIKVFENLFKGFLPKKPDLPDF